MGKEGSRYGTVISDLKSLGYDFRINDLDDGLEYRKGSVLSEGESPDWQRVSKVIKAVIKTDMRELGYGVSGSGKCGYGAMEDAILTRANNNRYNPIKEYFLGLDVSIYEPDGFGPYKIEQFAKYFANPDGWFKRWLFRWMVGCLAKIFQGQRNPMLVLDGPQDIGKSSFAEWLCPLPEHFIRDSISPDDKDSHLVLTDMLIWEVDEVDSTTRRADASALKAFITRDMVKKRPAYGEQRISKPALCSFIGTINFDGSGFLVDTTGNTRFLTCLIEKIDFSYDGTDVNELWTEAMWFYRNVPKAWKLTKQEREARNQINAQYEVPSAVEEVFLDHYEITNDPGDFEASQDIKDLLAVYMRLPNEQMFVRELRRIAHKHGLRPDRGVYTQGLPHKRGYSGLKRISSD